MRITLVAAVLAAMVGCGGGGAKQTVKSAVAKPVVALAKTTKPAANPSKTANPNDEPARASKTPVPTGDLSKKFPAPPHVAAPPAHATKTKSGLAFLLLKKAAPNATRPSPNDTVSIHFSVWRTSGKFYYSTRQRGKALSVALFKTPPGWQEAVSMMAIGEQRRFWMPASLGHTKATMGAQMLVYEIELVAVKRAPTIPTDLAKPPRTASRTKSGIRYRILRKGTGSRKARLFDRVTYRRTGWTVKGVLFDDGDNRGNDTHKAHPYQLSVGLHEAIEKMTVGAKLRAWIPAHLAKRGTEKLPTGTLVYDLEVVAIDRMSTPPPVPSNVAKPPKNARKTTGGVSYVVLKKGTGTKRPTATDTVKVHYTGWTTNGRMFDSSVVRGQPSEFPLNAVIKGWTEGLAVMVEGETTRFWIPETMAYKGRPGAPQGMLVFDVQLLKIK